jgi:hypothetical protein
MWPMWHKYCFCQIHKKANLRRGWGCHASSQKWQVWGVFVCTNGKLCEPPIWGVFHGGLFNYVVMFCM